MKGVIKAVIAGVIIIAIGAAILIGTLAYNGWSVKPPEFEKNTYSATQENNVINIEIDAGSVKTEFYDGDKITVEYPFAKNYEPKISENNGVFSYKFKIKRFGLWSFRGNWNIPDTVIKLPKGIKFDVSLDINAGTANVAEGDYGRFTLDMDAGTVNLSNANYGDFTLDIDAGTFNAGQIVCNKLEYKMSAGTANVAQAVCNEFDCKMSAGTAKIEKIDCASSRIKLSAGSAKMGFAGAREEYSISTKVSAGSCNVGNQTGSTEKSINVNVSAGSVKLDFAV